MTKTLTSKQLQINQMVCDMRGISSLETEIKIAKELLRAGYIKRIKESKESK